ncbi:hypothetical protein DdX_08303 [Ditylenchus destructor]|uniref:Uncharacterized protein n=1 Tax=Ditylenchus destructor TaxID=166010 RepID=A0AAD4N4V7_9BILA|nr:hypothetical protein DdX_08303 [Ditylenchus destructor]
MKTLLGRFFEITASSSELMSSVNSALDWTNKSLQLVFSSIVQNFQSRTSGVLLMAGVGSYCAYRICKRFLGKDFVWTILDSAKCDLLARADSRLLHPAAEGFYTVRLGEDDLKHIQDFLQSDLSSSARDESGIPSCPKSISTTSKCSTFPAGCVSKWRTLDRTHQKGLASIAGIEDEQPGPSSSIFMPKVVRTLRREAKNESRRQSIRRDSQFDEESEMYDDDDARSTISGLTDMTSVSQRVYHPITSSTPNSRHYTPVRQIPPQAAKNFRNRTWSMSTASAIGDARETASVMSGASASIRLVWQGEQDWDDEFQDSRMFSATPSGISQLSAFKNLEKMFKERSEEPYEEDWLVQAELPPSSLEKTLEQLDIKEEEGIEDENDGTPFLSSKCLANPDYMYHSVTLDRGDLAQSEIMSVCSTRSLASLRREMTPSQGLWELTRNSRKTPEKKSASKESWPSQCTNMDTSDSIDQNSKSNKKDQMTDSCFSKSSFASSSGITSAAGRENEKRETAHLSVMYDSAIGMSESMTTGTDPGDYYAHTISGTESEVSDHSTLSKVRGKRHLKNDGVRRRTWRADEAIEESPIHTASGN